MNLCYATSHHKVVLWNSHNENCKLKPRNGEQEQENSNCTGELKAVDEDNSTVSTITLSRHSIFFRKMKKKIEEVVLRKDAERREAGKAES